MTTPTTTAPLVELTGVSKSYGNVRALRDVSLEAHAGRTTCVLGDSRAWVLMPRDRSWTSSVSCRAFLKCS